ncbi:hypothetical protein QJQ45_026251 [Haematococcus lacustris]|nr:hypothetical protein QJQ45_026251 [Haematococcus lacustris]
MQHKCLLLARNIPAALPQPTRALANVQSGCLARGPVMPSSTNQASSVAVLNDRLGGERTLQIPIRVAHRLLEPPSPPGVKPSSAYASTQLSEDEASAWAMEAHQQQEAPAPAIRATSPTPNAMEWALYKVDQRLDVLETNPLPIQQTIYDISRGPVGEATTSAVQAAAHLTVKASVEAAKAVAPLGRWALAEGTKAAGHLIKAALVHSLKVQERKGSKRQ